MSTAQTYYNFIAEVYKGKMDCVNDVFKVALVNGYAFDATHTVFSSVSSYELPAGSGYTSGGEVIGGKSVSQTAGVMTWDGNNVSWVATGSMIASGAVVYNTTDANALISYIDFGGAVPFVIGQETRIAIAGIGLLTSSPSP